MRSDCRPWLVLACVCSLGCADFHRGPGRGDAAAEAVVQADVVPDEDLTFEAEVYPILQLRCEDCHKRGGMSGHTRLVLTGNARLDRAMVMTLVAPGDAAASLLLQRATGNSHTGGRVLVEESEQYGAIARWIMLLPLP